MNQNGLIVKLPFEHVERMHVDIERAGKNRAFQS